MEVVGVGEGGGFNIPIATLSPPSIKTGSYESHFNVS